MMELKKQKKTMMVCRKRRKGGLVGEEDSAGRRQTLYLTDVISIYVTKRLEFSFLQIIKTVDPFLCVRSA